MSITEIECVQTFVSYLVSFRTCVHVHEERCLRDVCFFVSRFLPRGMRVRVSGNTRDRAGVSAADTDATGEGSAAAPVFAAVVLQGIVAGLMMGEGSLMLCLMSCLML